MSESLSISIALPVRNGANSLREALDSICAQTFSDFELVISDNASTDGTPHICEEYAHRDRQIKMNRSEVCSEARKLVAIVPCVSVSAIYRGSGFWKGIPAGITMWLCV